MAAIVFLVLLAASSRKKNAGQRSSHNFSSLYTGAGAAVTCSVGTNSTDNFGRGRNPRNGRVHINTMEAAMCNGRVYGWNYCLRPRSSTRELKVAMYRLQPNGTYRQVEGSYFELRIEFDAYRVNYRSSSDTYNRRLL